MANNGVASTATAAAGAPILSGISIKGLSSCIKRTHPDVRVSKKGDLENLTSGAKYPIPEGIGYCPAIRLDISNKGNLIT